MHRVVYLCDWLPPDFGAVGQYSLQFARERASHGEDVKLFGLSSTKDSVEERVVRSGRLTVIRLRARAYDKTNFCHRALWTAHTNFRLMCKAWPHMKTADEILFTGSPPFLLHFLAPANFLLRKNLTYRITDFHPECLMAAMDRIPVALRLFYRLTLYWRKKVNRFEILGEDQRHRLTQIGIPHDRISMKRDYSPVVINPETGALARPASLANYVLLMYSGNYSEAHEYETFVEGYRRHHRSGSGRVGLWLNSIGGKADTVERILRADGLPIYRTRPVPLKQLANLLVTPDAHLITLRDQFVGFVMPSKVYGCIESGRDVLFVGSPASDVHLLCNERMQQGSYHHAQTGDAAAVFNSLEAIADRFMHGNGIKEVHDAHGAATSIPLARNVC